ncbi:MAG: N-acetyltransferase [Planctomycetes bacterium]|nr:N-acetyltransferase [Planctomycetota bacterium]
MTERAIGRLQLRAEAPADHAAVDALLRDAFGGPAEAELLAELRRDEATLSLVATLDRAEFGAAAVVGHVAASRATARSGATGVVGLAPLAVAAPWRRNGIGARLMEEALAQLRARGERLVVLVGSVDYYRRFGFVPAAPHRLACRWPEFAPHFQLLELVAGSAAQAAGAIDYHPAFDRF